MKTILILEDNDERIAAFRKVVAAFGDGFELKLWRDAPSMCEECEEYFPTAALISLSHGDDPRPWETGLDAAKFLAQARPVCPVIIHSGDTDHACSMENELRFADWSVERFIPSGKNWIETGWLQKATDLLSGSSNTWPARLPHDHDERLSRAILSFDGLSVGDGFGECFFTNSYVIERRLEYRDPPPGPWFITDDTMMSLSIVRCLKRYGYIQQDALAAALAREYARDPQRGYGGTAHGILRSIGEGTSWKIAAQRVFGGEGSCGNGGAMRSAPIGAYFADDYERVTLEAKLSAEVTHAHPDGQTGVSDRIGGRLDDQRRPISKTESCPDPICSRTHSTDRYILSVEKGAGTPVAFVTANISFHSWKRDSGYLFRHSAILPLVCGAACWRLHRGIVDHCQWPWRP